MIGVILSYERDYFHIEFQSAFLAEVESPLYLFGNYQNFILVWEGTLCKVDLGPDPDLQKNSNPGPLEKLDFSKKFTVWVKNSYLTNLKVLISNMTMLFSNFSPKISKSDIFMPNLRIFYFCTKLCNKTDSRVLISNRTKLFLNSNPKIPK